MHPVVNTFTRVIMVMNTFTWAIYNNNNNGIDRSTESLTRNAISVRVLRNGRAKKTIFDVNPRPNAPTSPRTFPHSIAISRYAAKEKRDAKDALLFAISCRQPCS